MKVAIQPAVANAVQPPAPYPRPRFSELRDARRTFLSTLKRPRGRPRLDLDPDCQYLPRLERSDCEPGYLFQLCGGGRRIIRVPSTY